MEGCEGSSQPRRGASHPSAAGRHGAPTPRTRCSFTTPWQAGTSLPQCPALGWGRRGGQLEMTDPRVQGDRERRKARTDHSTCKILWGKTSVFSLFLFLLRCVCVAFPRGPRLSSAKSLCCVPPPTANLECLRGAELRALQGSRTPQTGAGCWHLCSTSQLLQGF